MDTPIHNEKNSDLHINTAEPPPPGDPITHSSTNPAPLAPPGHALRLLPATALERKFRAKSFVAKLTAPQRRTLSLWLHDEKLSVDAIRQKITAPPPDGFGLQVQPTTLYRLRAFVKNAIASDWLSNAMDTACDLLQNPDSAEAAPLRETLTLMLYSRAVYAVQNQALPATIEKIVTTINKLEKLKTRSAHPPREKSEPTTTRHRVELSIVPANTADQPAPKIIELTTTALPRHDDATK